MYFKRSMISNGLYDIISIAAAPPFPGLRRFHQGQGFKQWTGDDSKALMKVMYLQNFTNPCSRPCLRFFFLQLLAMFELPSKMVRAIKALREFCYIVRKNVHDETTLSNLEDALDRFHRFRTVFQECGVRPEGFSLPRQHSLIHYFPHICLFGAPNPLFIDYCFI
jgi:hypothetical protein